MDSRIKPNTRGCFAFGEFSVVCGNARAERPFGGDSAREVSPPAVGIGDRLCEADSPLLFAPEAVLEVEEPFC